MSKHNIAETHLSDTAQVDSASVAPLPGSQKIYVEGSRPDIRVPMREIALTDTQTEKGPEKNASIRVYDTSGPYTDPAVSIDVRKGLPDVRSQWILERNDTELLDSSSSTYTQERLDDTNLAHLRFRHLRVPRRAKAGCNVSQMHYAKKRHHYAGNGIHRNS
jgi:phosphomethylpyrimidine synthase